MSSSSSKSPAPAEAAPMRTGRRASGGAGASPDEISPFSEAGWLGRVIDERYRIEQLLGEGGMGAVFLAEHLKLQKKVALKIILPQFAGDGEIAERFAREAMASARLDHPHVASAMDYGTLPEGGAYLVMQFVKGRSLRALAGERAGDVALVCRVGAQIADALAAAHAAGIVHRDLKPDNVFLESGVDGDDRVRVLDFGIARVLGDDPKTSSTAKPLTRVGTVIGTPGYMAPEQALGETVDERADLYALGVVLWELLAGRPLFSGDDMTAIVTAQLTTEPPLPLAGLPPELESLLMRLLARDRASRPSHAFQVRDALRSLAQGASIGGDPSRASLAGHSALTMMKDAGSQASAPMSAAAMPSHLPLPLVGLLAAMALGLGAAVLVGVIAFMSGPPAVAVAPSPPVATPHAPAAPMSPMGEAPATEPPLPSGVDVPEDLTGDPAPVAAPSAGLGEDFDTLLNADDRDARRAAALRLRSAPEGGPAIARIAADIELAERCNDRRDALIELRELGDARGLPLVERLDDLPRRGCGFLRTQDCWRCMRSEIRRAREALSPE